MRHYVGLDVSYKSLERCGFWRITLKEEGYPLQTRVLGGIESLSRIYLKGIQTGIHCGFPEKN
jgi:hypothetical protein